jgi:NAD(P)-dependent dehydrogenase (short-subunit alcohol dehydrogenase family)
MDIEGKRIIVTGAARGLGEGALRVFARKGAIVAGLDVRDDLGEAVARAATEEGPGRAVYHHCDVRSKESVQSAVAAAVADLGGLDGLVHIAGVEGTSTIEDMPEEEWDRILDINLKGTFLMNQAVFPHLRESGAGRILNFASSAGLIAFPTHSPYATAKAGVMAFSRTAAYEWGKYNINVNAILPFADTPMNAEFEASMTDQQREAFRAHVAAIPLGRMGDVEEDIAPMLVFLLSDAGRYITAQLIALDGGNVPVR